MRIILIANFLPDKQESMNRFANMLSSAFQQMGYESEIWYPTVFFSSWSKSTLFGVGKWLGYLDKWILYPLILRWYIYTKYRSLHISEVRFHICDHSNAIYLNHLPADQTSITCHDVLAIRGALGYADAYCQASGFGKILQQSILQNLAQARRLATVSQFTLNQLHELIKNKNADTKNWRVIHNSFNNDFAPMDIKQRTALLEELGLEASTPFLLHVGSHLPRKNRKLLLDMLYALGSRWNGKIYYAGQPLDGELKSHAIALGIQDRVVSIPKPDHNTLVALYSSCEAFVFPSFSEGFGWPIIEAQACGAPVITSNIEPMPEVSGGAALHIDPLDPKAYAKAFLTLSNDEVRNDLISRGFANCFRFELSKMISSYLNLIQADESKTSDLCY